MPGKAKPRKDPKLRFSLADPQDLRTKEDIKDMLRALGVPASDEPAGKKLPEPPKKRRSA